MVGASSSINKKGLTHFYKRRFLVIIQKNNIKVFFSTEY